MMRISLIGAIVFLASLSHLPGQVSDSGSEDTKDIALLKRTISNQDQRIAALDRRIAALERTVGSQQAAIQALTRRSTLVAWRNPEGWAAIKIGMSRAQVVDILGEPRSTEAVIDRQTLIYKEGNDPIGSVVIIDDRVSEVISARFQIHIPQKN